MAVYESCRSITAVAGESLTAGLHKFGVYNSSGSIIVNTTAQAACAGIIGMNAASGSTTVLIVPDGGRAKVISAATITAGDKIASDNAGKAIAWGTTAGDNCMGIAIDSAVTGDVFAIQLLNCDVYTVS